MARRKRKKKAGSRSHDILMVFAGGVLTLCVLSVMYGFLIRKSVAEGIVKEFRIEILNGTDEKGLAARAATGARGMGIDVFHVDNAPEHHEESMLVARREVENLDVLAQALGCRNFIELLDADSFVDATLILGADYRSLNLNLDSSSGLIR